jgi:tRNA threonylcarbamoyladenosine biosynthesis protein TsaE
MDIISKSEKETFGLGAKLAADLKGGKVFALFGDLGAGKTTFVKGLAKSLGIQKTIKSPTFNIMKIYPTDHNEIKYLVHIDAYRLTSLADADSIGLSEVIDNKENVVLIEWPENVWPIIKNKSKSIKFLFIDKNSRQISY